ncbi:MAG TPA: DinB family protein, partial [Candidatus Eisenbacteria bacterium]|nr:DinB family protein [Candidatus Eisenbacteria bacterium]
MKHKISPTEATRIADQLRRAFDGSAWHGPALLEILADVDAAAAAARPIANVHSIWELVLHIAAWDGAGLRRLAGK